MKILRNSRDLAKSKGGVGVRCPDSKYIKAQALAELNRDGQGLIA
jgi:hypothetical protein